MHQGIMQRLCEDTHKGSPRETGRQAGDVGRYVRRDRGRGRGRVCPAPPRSCQQTVSNTRGQAGVNQQPHRCARANYTVCGSRRTHLYQMDRSLIFCRYILNVSCSSCLLPATTRRLNRPGGLPLPKKRRQHRSSDDVATVSCLRRRLAQTRALISQHSPARRRVKVRVRGVTLHL